MSKQIVKIQAVLEKGKLEIMFPEDFHISNVSQIDPSIFGFYLVFTFNKKKCGPIGWIRLKSIITKMSLLEGIMSVFIII